MSKKVITLFFFLFACGLFDVQLLASHEGLLETIQPIKKIAYFCEANPLLSLKSVEDWKEWFAQNYSHGGDVIAACKLNFGSVFMIQCLEEFNNIKCGQEIMVPVCYRTEFYSSQKNSKENVDKLFTYHILALRKGDEVECLDHKILRSPGGTNTVVYNGLYNLNDLGATVIGEVKNGSKVNLCNQPGVVNNDVRELSITESFALNFRNITALTAALSAVVTGFCIYNKADATLTAMSATATAACMGIASNEKIQFKKAQQIVKSSIFYKEYLNQSAQERDELEQLKKQPSLVRYVVAAGSVAQAIYGNKY